VLELRKLADVFSGVALRESSEGCARIMRLSDLTDLKAGRFPTLAVSEIPDVARASAIQDGDIVVAARGSSTDICLATEALVGAFISLDLYLVRPHLTKVDPRYLFAFLTLPATQSQFSAGKQGTGLPRLPKEGLEKIEVPVLPMEAQRMIAGLAASFEEEGKVLKKLTELNIIFGREVIARAIDAATAANHKRSDQ
jgi:restriction endonuclease S subunit